MLIYASCLLLSSYHIVRCIGLSASVLVVGAFVTRISIPRRLSNKYVIWGLFLLVANIMTRLRYASIVTFEDTVQEITMEMPAVRGACVAAIVYGAQSAASSFSSNRDVAAPVKSL